MSTVARPLTSEYHGPMKHLKLSRFLVLTTALHVLAGCASQDASRNKSDPAVRADAAETPIASAVPGIPWKLDYMDGSANTYRFRQDAIDQPASFAYVPVTPEGSSSGTYSGGEPISGNLTGPEASQLWGLVRQLEAATADHVTDRAMGTGSFSYKAPAGNGAFLVKQEALGPWNVFTRSLKVARDADSQLFE